MSASKKTTAPKGNFALVFDSSTGACPRCSGLPTLQVTTTAGVIGYVVADWPWDTSIPDDPAQHPNHPHYIVEWFAQDRDGHDILGIRAGNPYFIARAIHDLHRQQA